MGKMNKAYTVDRILREERALGRAQMADEIRDAVKKKYVDDSQGQWFIFLIDEVEKNGQK